MAGLHLLIVEDESGLAENLCRGFGEEGCVVEWAGSAEAAERVLASRGFDVIVLDLRLPGKDGLTLLRQLRSSRRLTPVLILTAHASLEERVGGLEAGADDYLAKPFAFAELLARVKALARRHAADSASLLKVGGLEFDTVKRRAWREGRSLNLSPKESMLLELLMRHSGEVVTRDMIAETVWGAVYNEFTNMIEVFV
ncbi:MAG: response regulator transcription factor, partial [Terriglobia bacterium]